METELLPIWVSVRTRLATEKARWKSGSRVVETRRLRGRRCRNLDLAEDLRLADDHGVERRGYAEEMADGFALAELVEVGLDGVGGNGEVLVQEAQQAGIGGAGGFVLPGDELDAVAGGENESSRDAGLMRERADGRRAGARRRWRDARGLRVARWCGLTPTRTSEPARGALGRGV